MAERQRGKIEFHASLLWTTGGGHSTDNPDYTRNFKIHYRGGSSLTGSSALPYGGDESLVCPEEQFVSSVSSCLMLAYLNLAWKNRIKILRYEDDAKGLLRWNEEGILRFEEIHLNPRLIIDCDYGEEVRMLAIRMIHEARYDCFISNSIVAKVEISPLFVFQ